MNLKTYITLILSLGVLVFLGAFFVTGTMRTVPSGDEPSNDRDATETPQPVTAVAHGPCLQGDADRDYVSLEAALADPLHVCTLALRNKGLREFPEEIYEMRNIVRIDLMGNDLTAIPEDIVGLENVRILMLTNNQISNLPSRMSEMERLRRVDLSRNLVPEGEQERIRQMLPRAVVNFN